MLLPSSALITTAAVQHQSRVGGLSGAQQVVYSSLLIVIHYYIAYIKRK